MKPEPIKSVAFALALTLVTYAAIEPAFAQVAVGGGGAGAGAIGQFIQWAVTNIVAPVFGGWVIFKGVGLFFGHHAIIGIVAGIAGALLIANYTTIAGFFGLGGLG